VPRARISDDEIDGPPELLKEINPQSIELRFVVVERFSKINVDRCIYFDDHARFRARMRAIVSSTVEVVDSPRLNAASRFLASASQV